MRKVVVSHANGGELAAKRGPSAKARAHQGTVVQSLENSPSDMDNLLSGG